MSQKTTEKKGQKHLKQLFIGMDQHGTRFSGRPKDLLHLFLSGQIDLVNDVFMPNGKIEEKKAMVMSMAQDVIKVLEEMENEKVKDDRAEDSTDSEQDTDVPNNFQI